MEVIIMIEYTTKNSGLANYTLTLKTNNLILLTIVESEIKKAKSKEEGSEYTSEVQESIKSIPQKDEKKTITISIEMS